MHANTSSATIRLRSIKDLLHERFFVPAYQRGYRWTDRQVEDLLADIWEFQSASDGQDKASFYCLQPVVVKQRGGGDWELIDGQQRLTTILLILIQLKQMANLINPSSFTLNYETRAETSGAFLSNIDRSKRSDNIDYHHICNAADAIERWFAKKDGSHTLKFLMCLLNGDDLGRNVKVIWYELPEEEDPVAAFTRLNVGKIPLANAELIRALFLRSGNFQNDTQRLQQLKIAQEWDAIEKVLQSDDVWYFLNREVNDPASRIEFVFELIAADESEHHVSADDPYATFHFYNSRIQHEGNSAESEWLKVKQHFMTLEEWCTDRGLYHLIGYLIDQGDALIEIRRLGSGVAKTAFERVLKKRIFKILVGQSLPEHSSDSTSRTLIESHLNELEYGSHSGKIRSYLLLFNIATLLQNRNSNLRFPFDSYKKEEWDLEHVRSVDSEKPNRADAKKQWLGHAINYLAETGGEEALLQRGRAEVDASTLNEDQFDKLYGEILRLFGEDGNASADNSIGNLALLDAATNRSYKNAVFPIKRKRILGLDKTGTFVPLCTKNVFTKCYSDQINNMMFWTDGDAASYRQAIVGTLCAFFDVGTETAK